MLFLRRSGKALDPSNSTEIPELLKFQLFKVSYRARLSRLVQFTTSHVGQTLGQSVSLRSARTYDPAAAGS